VETVGYFIKAAKNNLPIVTLIATIILAFTGYMMAYVNARLLAKKKEQLELINRQINEFYGPLYVATQTGKMAYLALTKKLGKEDIFAQDTEPSLEELEEWYLWMKTVFMPLNETREKIIIEKAHLIIEEQMPDCLLQFVTHVVSYKAVMAKWSKGDFSEKFSLIDFPESLDDYAARSFVELKKRQVRLLGKM
jgi:hypothetical protein